MSWTRPVLLVVAVALICGFTLYWTQSRFDALSTRLDALDRQARTGAQYASVDGSQPAGATGSQGTVQTAGAAATGAQVRLARIVKCDPQQNLVTVTYDPAQLFTGEDAVRLAASRGDAVTGDSYVFDPNHDVFTGDAPEKTAVVIHTAPPGWTGTLPATVKDLAADLQSGGGQAWSEVYFWLHFNAGYVVSIEQYSAENQT
jgi:hypothetical protein